MLTYIASAVVLDCNGKSSKSDNSSSTLSNAEITNTDKCEARVESSQIEVNIR